MRITEWMPVTKHLSSDGILMYTCIMPDNNERIIISTSQGIAIDICTINDAFGYGLVKRHSWDGVDAWMSAPEPYIPIEQ